MVHDPPYRRWPSILAAPQIAYNHRNRPPRQTLIPAGRRRPSRIAELDPLTGGPTAGHSSPRPRPARHPAYLPSRPARLDDFKTVNDPYGHPASV